MQSAKHQLRRGKVDCTPIRESHSHRTGARPPATRGRREPLRPSARAPRSLTGTESVSGSSETLSFLKDKVIQIKSDSSRWLLTRKVRVPQAPTAAEATAYTPPAGSHVCRVSPRPGCLLGARSGVCQRPPVEDTVRLARLPLPCTDTLPTRWLCDGLGHISIRPAWLGLATLAPSLVLHPVITFLMSPCRRLCVHCSGY